MLRLHPVVGLTRMRATDSLPGTGRSSATCKELGFITSLNLQGLGQTKETRLVRLSPYISGSWRKVKERTASPGTCKGQDVTQRSGHRISSPTDVATALGQK